MKTFTTVLPAVSVTVTEKQIYLLRALNRCNFLWNYDSDLYSLDDFDALVQRNLADEDGEGRVRINKNGIHVLDEYTLETESNKNTLVKLACRDSLV